jgi:acetolactate synthase-1/2/3 large subunit
LFGVPGGGSNLELIGACEQTGIRFALCRGETAAAIAAGAYGESTGRPGACVVTRGPGLASAVNGVAQALLDRAPMLIVSDMVAGSHARRVSHQRLDQHALMRPVTKWSASVGDDEPGRVVESALRLASEPAPGPVHLSIDPGAAPRSAPRTPRSLSDELKAACRLAAQARSPVVAVGLGARRAAGAVSEACAELGCPILTTYKAKGVIPESSSRAAGLLTGATIEAPLLREADLIVAIGLDPVELIPAPWPYAASILSLAEWHADAEYFTPTVEVVGPLEQSLEALAPLRGQLATAGAGLASLQRALDVPGGDGLLPQDVVRAVRTACPAGTIATVDSGAHMFPAMAYWTVDVPGEVLISSGLATMGFALPAAIGAAQAHSGRRVVCLTGDGGLGMALAELETAARYSLPIVIIVLNDSALSLIEIKQREGQGAMNAVRYSGADFAAIARAFGLGSRQVTTLEELRDALDAALAEPGPFLIDVVVDPAGYPAMLHAIRGGTR